MSATIQIKIKPLAKHHGYTERIGNNGKYIIFLDLKASPLRKFRTLIHEFVHVAFWILFNETTIDEKKEHLVCEKTESAAVRFFKRYYWSGT